MLYSLHAAQLRPPLVLCPLMKELSLVLFISCAVDGDHFIAARSLRLSDAQSLSHRPMGHSFSTCFVLTAIVYFTSASRHFTALVSTFYCLHLFKDGLRRGLWLWPIGTSTPISFPSYFMILLALPHSLLFLIHGFSLRRKSGDYSSRPLDEDAWSEV